MRILIGLLLLLSLITSCTFAPKDLKSPCVANESPGGTPVPCVKRNVNDHWLS